MATMTKRADGGLAKFSDQEWRLDNLYWIVNDQGIEMPFVRNNAQLALWCRRWYWNLISRLASAVSAHSLPS